MTVGQQHEPASLHLDGLVVELPDGRRLGLDHKVTAGQVVVVDASPEDATPIARTVVGLGVHRVDGALRVAGRDVTERRPNDRGIGYVPAGGGLLPHLTLRENLEYGLVRRSDTTGDMVVARLRAATEHFDLALVLHVRPHEATEDERLRVALGRAAVGFPLALVIDAPAPVGRGDGEPMARLCGWLRNAGLPRAPVMAVLICSSDPAVRGQADAAVRPVELGGVPA